MDHIYKSQWTAQAFTSSWGYWAGDPMDSNIRSKDFYQAI